MAAIGVALWKYVMRYAPHTPTYFNRDRFVLSNGKLCNLPHSTSVIANHRRTHLSVPVLVPPPHRLQSHDFGPVEVLSF